MHEQSALQSFLGMLLLHSLFFLVSQEECHRVQVSLAALERGAVTHSPLDGMQHGYSFSVSRLVLGSTCVLNTAQGGALSSTGASCSGRGEKRLPHSALAPRVVIVLQLLWATVTVQQCYGLTEISAKGGNGNVIDLLQSNRPW